MARVVLAMSGGVDSSASAVLLKRQGYDVVGLFMRTGAHGHDQGNARADHKKGCCSATDAGDARRVADKLDIPFYALDFEAEFGRIIDYFADEYTKGRTPNPCVVCNNWLKFGQLWAFGQKLGADFIATGHYARVVGGELHKGVDAEKDQSYVLHGIRRAVLPHLLFPVGGYTKPEIRHLAREAGLVDTSGTPFVTWPELRAMHTSGVIDVQSHALTHAAIFCSDRPVNFVTPAFAREPLLVRPLVSGDGRDARFLGPADLGAPLYVQRSRLSDARRFRVSAEVVERATSFVKAEGGAVNMLRNSQSGPNPYPVKQPEYTNWRDETQAWQKTCVLFNQSYHMADLAVEGPDALKLLTALEPLVSAAPPKIGRAHV